MLSVEQAREQVFHKLKTALKTEWVPLECSLGRIIAEDLCSPIAVPPEPNSAMDGYAIEAPSTEGAELSISMVITAGQSRTKLQSTTAARIFTGAVIPENANAVIIQENCTVSACGSKVQLNASTQPGANVRPAGQDIPKGSVIVTAGTQIKVTNIGLLASCGLSQVKVFKRPKVALINTGSELIKPGQTLSSGQIYNSNAYFLQALFEQWGCEIVKVEQIPDSLGKTKDCFRELANISDLIVSSGGVSVGDEDHVKAAISELGEIDFWKVKMKPGKPIAYGNIPSLNDRGKIPVFCLPGNPVSAFITANLFIKAHIESLYGKKYQWLKKYKLPVNFQLTKALSRPEFARVNIRDSKIEKLENQSSGVLSSISNADGLVHIPEDTAIHTEDLLDFIPMKYFTQLA